MKSSEDNVLTKDLRERKETKSLENFKGKFQNDSTEYSRINILQMNF